MASQFTGNMKLELISAGASNGNETTNDNNTIIDKGRTHDLTMGTNGTAGLWFYLDSVTQKLLKAKANAKLTSKVKGIGCLSQAEVTDATAYPRENGSLEMSDWTNVIGAVSLTAGAEYFLSKDNEGMMVTTAPSDPNYIIKLGYAETITKFIIAIQEYIEGGAGGGQAIYDAIVCPLGTGDYLLLRDAVDNEPIGASIFVKSGEYIETGTIELKAKQKVTGENRDDCIISNQSIWMQGSRLTDAGSVGFTSGSKTVLGVGTSFTSASASDHIMANDVPMVIASITSDTTLVLSEPFYGTTDTGLAFEIYDTDESLGMSVENLTVRDATTYGFYLKWALFSRLENCKVVNLGTGKAIYLSNVYNCDVIGNVLDDSGADDGIWLEESYGCRVLNNFACNMDDDGFRAERNVRDCVISGNKFNQNNDHGIYDDDGGNKRNRYTDNECSFNDGWGIVVEDSDYIVIKGNSVYKNRFDGIWILGTSWNVVVSNNVCAENDYDDIGSYNNIRLSGFLRDTAVIGNTCYEAGKYEISIETNVTRARLAGNSMRGIAHVGDLYDVGTDTRIGKEVVRKTVAPTINDDVDSGYIEGLIDWLDTVTRKMYTLTDDTAGNAVWKELATISLYDKIIDAGGGGDYLLPSTACASESTDVTFFMKSGFYNEVTDVIVKSGQKIKGENRHRAVIDFGSTAHQVLVEGGTLTTTGSIASVANYTVNGNATQFQTDGLQTGDFIILANTPYEIASVTNEILLTIVELFERTTYAGSYFAGTFHKDIELSNFKVTGVEYPSGQEGCIEINNVINSTFENLVIYDNDKQHASGMEVDSCWCIGILSNDISWTEEGITLRDVYSSAINRNKITQMQSVGLDMTLCENNVVSHNTIMNNGGNGIDFASTNYYNIIDSNVISYNNLSGIDAGSNFSYNNLSCNVIDSNGRHGVFLSAVTDDNNSISGNTIINNDVFDTATYDGIYVAGDYNLIVANILYNNDRYEINGNGGTGNLVSGNTTYGTDHVGEVNDAGGGLKGSNYDWTLDRMVQYGDTSYDNFFLATDVASPVTCVDGGSYDNIGAGGAVVYNLPTAVRGARCAFLCLVASNMVITAGAGDYIRVNGVSSSVAGTFTISALYTYVAFECRDGTNWIATTMVGGGVPA